jgi:DNA topoisomerase-1
MASKYVLVIAEKPDAARRIAEAIADSEPKAVEKRGATYYDFTVKNKRHICAPAVGHLFVLTPSKKHHSKGWNYPVFDLEWIPTYEKKGTAWTEKYYKNILELAKNASDFIDAADVDAEGEVLLFNILRFLCNVKDARRMKFSTLTKEELRGSYQKMEPHIMRSMLESGLTRHELDALWGFNLTRALTLALKNHAKRGFTILSTGRVQGPTLATLLEKELQIKKFKPRPFWRLELKVNVNGMELTATYEKARIWDRGEATAVVDRCEGKDAVVKDVKKRRYGQKPPVPFNTTNLQSEAYAQFKYSPRRTLGIAESLYQAGVISYPRSSSQKLPPIINYEKILEAIATLKPYAALAEELLMKAKLMPNEGKRTDPAHPAVYPTFEVANLRKLNSSQRKLYDLIIRRFLSVFGDPALRETNKVSIDVDGNEFILFGKRTIEPGWTKFCEKYLAFEEQILPGLKIGQMLKVHKLSMLSKETQPPGRYSQGSILKIMERKNLGTRATRAEILHTLYDRGYIVGKSIQVTKLGEVVAKVLKEFCQRILSEKLTRKFEEEMEQVYNGEKNRQVVVDEAQRVLIDVLKDFKENEEKIGEKLLKGLEESRLERRRLGVCPKCGGELKIVRSRRTGLFFVGCSGYPKCTNSYPLPHNARIDKTGRVCEKCGTPIVRVVRRGKRPFNMCLDPNCETKKDWGKKKLRQKGKIKNY